MAIAFALDANRAGSKLRHLDLLGCDTGDAAAEAFGFTLAAQGSAVATAAGHGGGAGRSEERARLRVLKLSGLSREGARGLGKGVAVAGP